MRVWELAKILNIDSKQILSIATEIKLPIKKSVLVNLDDKQEQLIRRAFADKSTNGKQRTKEKKAVRENRLLEPERRDHKIEQPIPQKDRDSKRDESKAVKGPEQKSEKSFDRESKRDERRVKKHPNNRKHLSPEAATLTPEKDETPAKDRRKPHRQNASPQQQQQQNKQKGKLNRRQFNKRNRYRQTNEVGKKIEKPKVVRERPVEVTVPISVKDFSQAIGVRTSQIIAKLLTSYNIRATVNQALDEDSVEAIALEFNKKIIVNPEPDPEETLLEQLESEDAPSDLQPRAPVVTFLGHVDHGKTSLLDKIRKTNVASKEEGGITQHIGAYKIVHEGNSIVFLDTPGHEAFTSMRARGANVTDIVVLVVAADDGVMPQTVEAINHAKAAGVLIVVALNKIDRPNAKPERAIQQLSKHGLVPEMWQGDTVFVEVSALTGQGIDELLEYLVLVSEMLELKANPKRKALGTVLEARMVEGKGTVATLLVQNGTLRRGDLILCGSGYGRVRALTDHNGKKIKDAKPSTPVEITGLSTLPEAGDKFYVVDSLAKAKEVAGTRKHAQKEKALTQSSRKLSIDEIMRQIQEGSKKELCIVLKTDVQGSVEALSAKLAELSHDEVKVKLLHAAVGGINETDVQLAFASEAIIFGFNVTANKPARDLAKDKGVEIKRYTVIYHLLEDVKNIMSGMLAPEKKEETTGHVTVRKVIRISKFGNIAGCYVTDGEVMRNSMIRISRQGVMLNNGNPLQIASLKRFKEDVGKVKEGFECGIRLEGFDDIKEGDDLEAFRIIEVARTLE